MIAILDYGSGNLRSAERAFSLTGERVIVTQDPNICAEADGLVIPGVGAYGACMEQLLAVGGEIIIRKRSAASAPIFGICVGEQILFSSGTEKGAHAGLGLLEGVVDKLDAPVLPHIGWNNVSAGVDSLLFYGVENERFYFVHSYAAKLPIAGAINSFTQYGNSFLAAIELGRIVATQFHPEKSGAAGATLIANWIRTL